MGYREKGGDPKRGPNSNKDTCEESQHPLERDYVRNEGLGNAHQEGQTTQVAIALWQKPGTQEWSSKAISHGKGRPIKRGEREEPKWATELQIC